VAWPIENKFHQYVMKNKLLINPKSLIFTPDANAFAFQAKAVSVIKPDGITLHGVALGALLLIDPKTIPEKFKVLDVHDDRLNDESFINDCIVWLNQEYFKIEEFNPIDMVESDRINLKIFLLTVGDPEMFAKMVEFIVLHEIAHHYLEHDMTLSNSESIIYHSFKTRLPFLVAGLAAGIFAGSYILEGRWSKIVLSTMGVFSTWSFYVYDLSSRLKIQREREKEADLMAIKVAKETDGLLHFFNKLIELQALLLEQKSEGERRQIANQQSNIYWLWDHPTHEERLAYLEAFVKGIPSKPLETWRPNVPFRWKTT